MAKVESRLRFCVEVGTNSNNSDFSYVLFYLLHALLNATLFIILFFFSFNVVDFSFMEMAVPVVSMHFY